MFSRNRTMNNTNMMNKTQFPSTGFFPKTKTISEIKRENLQTRQSTYNYIDTMYKTGTNFKYNFKKPYIGSHRRHLSNLENRVKENSKFTPDDIMKINILKDECNILRIKLREEYNKLKYEMITEIDNLQSKFDLELGKQKIKNIKINNQMKELKKEMLESQNFVMELKDRINSLKLRIDGNGMFNEDGVPVLQTRIEY